MKWALLVSPFTKRQAEKLANPVNLNKLICVLLCSLSIILELIEAPPRSLPQSSHGAFPHVVSLCPVSKFPFS